MIYTQLEELRGKEDELLKIDGKAVIMLTGDKGGNVQTGGNFMKFAYNIMKICLILYNTKQTPDSYTNCRLISHSGGASSKEERILK